MRSILAFLALTSAVFAFEGRALAAPPSTSMLAAEADVKDAISQIETRGSRPLSFELNPFTGVVATGVSGNFEFVPMRHFGLIASPRASVTMPAWVGEVGARYYTSQKREAAGFFVGPSMVYGSTRGDRLYGVALDAGVQTILDSGITLGAGLGVEYVQGAIGNSALVVGPLQSDETTHSSAVLPRLLFSIGYSL